MAPVVDPVQALRRADPAAVAVVTDFDGTLSPIVDDPASAGPIDGAVDALHALAARYGRVAVVSGRPVSFLRDRLELDRRPPSRLVLSGLYGIELLEGGRATTDETALRYRSVVDTVAAAADAAAPPGVGVERKGFSVTLHVRTAPEQAEWAAAWTAEAATANGLVVHEGRMSFEIRPPIDVDKGTVVEALVAGRQAACFLGDDYGDLPAFDALDRLTAATGAATLRVAVRSEEAPMALLDRADVVVDGPAGSLALLRSLL